MLRRARKVDESRPPTTDQPRVRRIAGAPLHQIAAANLVSEAATRNASRVIALGSQSSAKTSVMPVGNAWVGLPEHLVIRDYAAFVARLAQRGQRFLRPRVAAEDVFVLVVSRVERIGCDPAEQRLETLVEDECGAHATVSAEYRSFSKIALSVTAGAFTDEARDGTMLVSGTVTVQSGHITLTPLASWRGRDTPLVVPDLDVEVDSDLDVDVDSDLDVNPGRNRSHGNVYEAPAGQSKNTGAESNPTRQPPCSTKQPTSSWSTPTPQRSNALRISRRHRQQARGRVAPRRPHRDLRAPRVLRGVPRCRRSHRPGQSTD